MNPPAMAAWNLALRFGLELGAIAGLGLAAWKLTSGPVRWAAVTLIPLSAGAIWFAGRRDIGMVFTALVVFHYAASTTRIEWLVQA